MDVGLFASVAPGLDLCTIFPVQGDLPHVCEGWTIAQRFLRSSTTALVQVDLPSFTVV